MIFSGSCQIIKLQRNIPKNIHTSVSVLYVFVDIFLGNAHANVTISVSTVPEAPGGNFSASIVGASNQDKTRNPCYARSGCKLRFFTISESWLPSGLAGYMTKDGQSWQHTGGGLDHEYATVGSWWSSVTNKDRVGRDNLPTLYGDDPCVVLAADNGGQAMLVNTNISNCAKGLVQVPSCKVSPEQIIVTFDTTAGQDIYEQTVPGVQVSCSQSVDLRIETNSAEEIPLGGDNATVAILDWGRGYGRPGVFNLSGNESRPVPLRVKTRGIDRLGPGVYSGTAIVNVTYD